MFCQKCGTQNAEDATFCFNCGSKLIVIVQTETKQTIEKPTFIKSNEDSKRIEEVKKAEIKANQEPKRKSSGWGTLLIIIIVLGFLSTIFNSNSSLTNTVSPYVITSTNTVSSQVTPTLTPIPLPTSIFVTASPLQMLPTINDMPDGTIKGSETANDTYAKRNFIITGFVTQSLIYEVNKFSSNDKAIDKYNSIINTYSEYKLTDVNLGDESGGFEISNTLATVVFRKANTVVKVEFAGQYNSITLRDAISYAKMVNIPTSTQVVSSPSDTIVTSQVTESKQPKQVTTSDIITFVTPNNVPIHEEQSQQETRISWLESIIKSTLDFIKSIF